MAETVELTKLIEQSTQLHSELAQKHAALEQRLMAKDKGLFARLGIDADAETKANLLEMAGKIAEHEVTIQKMRRARVSGVAEYDPDGPLANGVKGSREPFFADPIEEAGYLARGTKEYRRALNNAFRKSGDGYRGLDSESLAILTFKKLPEGLEARLAPEVKSALSADFEQGAGFLAPPTMESEIDRVVLESSPLGELARVVNIGTGSYEGLIRTANRDTIAQRGEREARTKNTQVKRYEKRRIDVHESEAAPALTQTQLEDSVIDLVQELQSDATEDFAIDEGRKFINGTGIDEPEGLMVSEELLQMASGKASTFDMDALKKLSQTLKVPYKAGSVYLLSREALTLTMLFRENTGAGDGTGAYMWQPSTQDGTPSRLNGYGWREAVDMDAVAANAFPVAFGNFFQAYRVVRRRGIRILRDELTEKPFVIFFMTKRYGGRVWKGEAAVKMKIATSL